MKVITFVRSLALLGMFVVAVPWVLITSASVRFGGRTPWFGIPTPADWRWHRVQAALTDRLTEATIADIVIRVSLSVAWIAFAAIVVTIFAELAHMARHQGLPRPDIRGFAMPQRFARLIAAGLLVAIPTVGSTARAVSGDTAMRLLGPSQPSAHVMTFESSTISGGFVGAHIGEADPTPQRSIPEQPSGRGDRHTQAEMETAEYVVKQGDSVYGIAGRLVGPAIADVTDYAEQILDLNLGRTMPDGQQFNNAAYIDVGWTLQLPTIGAERAAAPVAGGGSSNELSETAKHVVRENESLWTIAETELGDGHLWNDVFAANEGRIFADGRSLTDPHLIQPGWDLVVPGAEQAAPVDAVPLIPAERPAVEPASPLLPDDTPSSAASSSARPMTPPILEAAAWETGARDAAASDAVASPSVVHVHDESTAPEADASAAGAASAGVASAGVAVWDPAAAAGTSPALIHGPDESTATGDPAQVTTAPVVLDLGSLPAAAPLPETAATQSSPAAEDVAEVVNSWQDSTTVAHSTSARADTGANTDTAATDRDDLRSESSVELFTFERAAMLAGGVLLLLAARRRQQLRAARPRARVPSPASAAASTERQLRAIRGGERFARVDLAVRAAAPSLAARGSRVAAVLIAADGTLELWATGPANLQAPWRGIGDRWSLPGDVPIEALATEARRVVAPSPTLVQLGVQRGTGRSSDRDVYVDLEAIGALEVGGSGAQADSIISAVATTLASSVLAEVTTLIGVGLPEDVFLGHRLHIAARDPGSAFAAAGRAIGTTAHQERSTFDLRVHATGGDTWEPAVVLVGASVGDMTVPGNLRGLAVVSGSAIVGPSSRLAPDGDAWVLRPISLRFVPIGLSDVDLAALVELVEPAPLEQPDAYLAEVSGVDTSAGRDDELGWHPGVIGETDDATVIVAPRADLGVDLAAGLGIIDLARGQPAPRHPIVTDTTTEAVPESQAPAILIRLLGPVTVEDAHGAAVHFERSKTKELLAWMVTHRERSSRTLARTALWDLDVRDATFANVVSEARRALARHVEPPQGEEWVGRTLTEALPLHVQVRSDVDVLTEALRVARLQPPSQAIATLAPAVELIRGMPFEGASYLWPDPEGIASNLVLLATTAAAELAAHCLSIGDVEGVFAATSRGLSVLSGHEELIGLRMRAHGDAGDLAGVRLEWESYARALLADPWSDGEPSPKLVSLRVQLLSPVR